MGFEDINIWIKKDGGFKPMYKKSEPYLHFPGTSGSYVQARDIHDFEIGLNDAEIEIDFRPTENQRGFLISTDGGVSPLLSGYNFDYRGDLVNRGLIAYIKDGGEISSYEYINQITEYAWNNVIWNWTTYTGTQNLTINNNVGAGSVNANLENVSINNQRLLFLGTLSGVSYNYIGDIRYFRFNDEEFIIDESSGSTITGSKGTVMDINGDVEWREESYDKVKIYTGMTWKDLEFEEIKINEV